MIYRDRQRILGSDFAEVATASIVHCEGAGKGPNKQQIGPFLLFDRAQMDRRKNPRQRDASGGSHL